MRNSTENTMQAWAMLSNIELIVSVHPVLSSILVVDVEWTARSVDGEHVVVGTDAIALCVLVCEHSRLQYFVIAECDTCKTLHGWRPQQEPLNIVSSGLRPSL